MFCPVCMSINTGKVGHNTYYCADCLLEFTENNGEVEIFYIDAEGSSFALKNKEAALRLVESIKSENSLNLQQMLEDMAVKN